jgi:hypothetical protein
VRRLKLHAFSGGGSAASPIEGTRARRGELLGEKESTIVASSSAVELVPD